jgi:type IV pilus assembly protein PilX
MPSRLQLNSPRHQSGAVLAVSLIMLLILSLIGVSASQNTGLNERMAGNARDRNLAFQAAESALLAADDLLQNLNIVSCPVDLAVNDPNPIGVYQPRDTDCDGITETLPVWEQIAWDNEDSIQYTGDLIDIDTNPRFIIENLGVYCTSIEIPCPVADLHRRYRVTARATGGSSHALVLLQTISIGPY